MAFPAVTSDPCSRFRYKSVFWLFSVVTHVLLCKLCGMNYRNWTGCPHEDLVLGNPIKNVLAYQPKSPLCPHQPIISLNSQKTSSFRTFWHGLTFHLLGPACRSPSFSTTPSSPLCYLSIP